MDQQSLLGWLGVVRLAATVGNSAMLVEKYGQKFVDFVKLHTNVSESIQDMLTK